MLHEHRFHAMNTSVALWLWSSSALADMNLRRVERLFTFAESQLSRFRPDSELSQLNLAAGTGPYPISVLLQMVLAQALKAARDSEGIFDPTILQPLNQAGYDRSFEQLPAWNNGRSDQEHVGVLSPWRPGRWREIRLDAANSEVAIPSGVGVDLGGIAKGWIVDQAAEILGLQGPALVDAGGDIRAVGAPGGVPWPIGVQDPFDEAQDLFTLQLEDSAVATSSIGGRRWQKNGQTMHHLIDPRTGKPSESNLYSVTVVASTAVQAEIAAKVALILGSHEGCDYLAARNLSGILIERGGVIHTVGALPLDDRLPGQSEMVD